MVIGGFASLTMLTKNSFLDEINKQYVLTARAKGLTENRVLYGHVFRNAMLIVIAGFPALFIHGSGPGVSAWANWRLVMPALSERLRVIAPDMAGFGFSERPAGIRYDLDTWVAQVFPSP